MISIGADAHSVAGIGHVEYGVGIARKGWLGPTDILNALHRRGVHARRAGRRRGALRARKRTRVRRGESASAPGSDPPASAPDLSRRRAARSTIATPTELLCATILSAQCTDARVNMVTPAFFARYPTPEDLARADRAEVEEIIRVHRVLPQQGAEPDRDGAGARGGPRRRGAAHHGGAPGAAGGRPEDGERRPWKRLRHQRGNHGGHPRHPALADCSGSPGTRTRSRSSRT